MQNFLSDLNLIYYLIYLDDIIVFSRTAEEHLHRLHVVFDQFREYHLKIKPSKCSLFKEEINYLVHQVSKEGVQPMIQIWEPLPNVHHPKPIWKFEPFLALWATIGSS